MVLRSCESTEASVSEYVSTVFKLRRKQSSFIQSPCLVPVETNVLNDIVICIFTFEKLAPDSKLCFINKYNEAAAYKFFHRLSICTTAIQITFKPILPSIHLFKMRVD